MTWTAWRQQRYAFLAFTVVTAVLIGWAVLSGTHAQANLDKYLAAPCHGGNGFNLKYQTYCLGLDRGTVVTYRNIIALLGVVLAASLGVVLGAGAVASDLENGTVRLAWTQSITRTHWFTTKILVGVGSVAILTMPLSITFNWWVHASRYDLRISPNGFAISGWMLLVVGVFAFAVAVFVGTLIRRAGWTVAVALVFTIFASTVMQNDVRSHLVPSNIAPVVTTVVTKGATTVHATHGTTPPNAWVLYAGYIPAGSRSVPLWQATFSMNSKVQSCLQKSTAGTRNTESSCLHILGLRNVQIYLSDSQFWTLQLRDGGLYLAGVVLLVVASSAVLRRRRA